MSVHIWFYLSITRHLLKESAPLHSARGGNCLKQAVLIRRFTAYFLSRSEGWLFQMGLQDFTVEKDATPSFKIAWDLFLPCINPFRGFSKKDCYFLSLVFSFWVPRFLSISRNNLQQDTIFLGHIIGIDQDQQSFSNIAN